MEKLAPLVVFVYNRPEHTKKMLDSLNLQPEASRTDLYIFSDQAKNEKTINEVELVRSTVDEFSRNQSVFKNVKIIYAEKNQGLAKSIISGVTEIINNYGNVIVVEDDLIVAHDFLAYMNAALTFYRSNKNIWSISGYTFEMDALKDYKYDVYISGRGCSWGWATWKERWNTVDWDVSDYNSIKFNLKKRAEFAKWGRDLPTLLDACVYGRIQSWAIRWCYAAFSQKKYTIYPTESRVLNIGADGSGTNFKSENDNYKTHLHEGNDRCIFENVMEDKRIQKEFKKRYMTNRQWFNSSVFWLIKKVGLIK